MDLSFVWSRADGKTTPWPWPEKPPVTNLLSVFREAVTLLPEQVSSLPCSLLLTNEADYDAQWARHLVTEAYAARHARFSAVVLGLLPAGTVLGGRHHFLLSCGGETVAESLPHDLRGDDAALAAAWDGLSDPVPFDRECVVLARYGHEIWGHWLGEILPAACLVEARFPGRFRFVVPAHDGRYGELIHETLGMVGIPPNRVLRLAWDRPLRLGRAWVVTPVWSDHAPHPGAVDLLRERVRSPTPLPARRVALLRRDWPTRQIGNLGEVAPLLEQAGFEVVDIAALPFREQITTFQAATEVFSVLGSGLTGLLFSPDQVGVVAAGPARWGDRFFYALGQLRDAGWIEVRGPSRWNGVGALRDAPFDIPLVALRDALSRLRGTS